MVVLGVVGDAVRVAIVHDGEAWFIQEIRVIEHVLSNDEKVYHCNRSIGSRYDTADAAIAALRVLEPEANPGEVRCPRCGDRLQCAACRLIITPRATTI